MKIVCIFVGIVFGLCAFCTEVCGITFVPPLAVPQSGYCFIQNYVDISPEQGGQDYATGSRSFQKHKGTDFRISYAAMLEGVEVLAAADGKVLRTRDGMADRYWQASSGDLKGVECGNGVLIDHGDGWHTQYCHMKEGSVRVHEGDIVAAGSVLGEVGLSGKTQFAHVHFQVSKDGQIVCPFLGTTYQHIEDESAGEGEFVLQDRASLWEDESSAVLQYTSPRLLVTSFSNMLPESINDVLCASGVTEVTANDEEPVIFSVVTAMLKKGDRLVIALRTLSGENLAERNVTVTSYTAQRYDYVGRLDSVEFVEETLEGIVELWRGDTRIFMYKSAVFVR
ncbi:M23 family metallopeptidase [Halodesulfovibrio spirochaetisodalis]|uniref:M23 family metallopeptidase n=1 Tax=Halodesulfovibrio spirochaetisodalis TaxID=1560234 RepID=UPI000AF28384|nr:M23 family metallopeptidase [Halodesulfovibrio spirochaetisodalis]